MTNWEERYQAGDTPWDKGTAHPALPGEVTSEPWQGKILVPGCGSGHDVRALAGTGAEVVGLDLAPSAIAAAERFARVGNESYQQGDLFALPSEWKSSFDGVFEHTCFCAIAPENREDYVAAVFDVLKPGGQLRAIFYLNPDHDEEGPPYGCSRAELDRLFGAGFDLVNETANFPTFPGREGRECGMTWQKKSNLESELSH